jgi:hypothetical protein
LGVSVDVLTLRRVTAFVGVRGQLDVLLGPEEASCLESVTGIGGLRF